MILVIFLCTRVIAPNMKTTSSTETVCIYVYLAVVQRFLYIIHVESSIVIMAKHRGYNGKRLYNML